MEFQNEKQVRKTSSLFQNKMIQTKISGKKIETRYHQRHAQIVKELKERGENDKREDRETVKRSFQSGEPNDPVDVERFLTKNNIILIQYNIIFSKKNR